MTLTYNNSSAWASGAALESSNTSATNLVLSDFSEQAFWDVVKSTTKPVIASHSSVYNNSPHPRNLKDDQIKAIVKNKGVVQVDIFQNELTSKIFIKTQEKLKKTDLTK